MEIDKKNIDSILDTFLKSPVNNSERADCTVLSIWVPIPLKEKYTQLQNSSNGKFGKILKDIVVESINRVCQDEKSA